MKISVGGDVGASGSARRKKNVRRSEEILKQENIIIIIIIITITIIIIIIIIIINTIRTLAVLGVQAVDDLDVVHGDVTRAASVRHAFHDHLHATTPPWRLISHPHDTQGLYGRKYKTFAIQRSSFNLIEFFFC